MKILQVLPELNSGGVERGTLEMARHLAQTGHEALVVSNGGRLVAELERNGGRHITMPVHRKRLSSLFQIRPFRRLLERERPEIVHIRSRVPGWIAWLAWRRMDPASRPRLVSTVHGFYSVNAYSAVMTRGERVIAVSESIRDYIIGNYPQTDPARIRVIPRGIDAGDYPRGFLPSTPWLQAWRAEYPQICGRIVLTLPGRITRLKGHEQFLDLVAALRSEGLPVHGLIVGDTHPEKHAYFAELQKKVASKALFDSVTFTGHRSDLREIMAVSDAVFSLSVQPESFGRTTLEAIALGKPVIGWNHGGVAEQLRALFPQGLVPPGNVPALLRTVLAVLHKTLPAPTIVGRPWTLAAMCESTALVWNELLHPVFPSGQSPTLLHT
ncbi:glycosyltransferase [Opitutaceae bacterium TAV1]|nr:glycosyltransferase [Opitutaceae bacterium TAV1]